MSLPAGESDRRGDARPVEHVLERRERVTRRAAVHPGTVSLVAGACLLVEAVIAKNVIDVDMDFFSQFVPMWIFIAYLVSGFRDRTSEIAFIAVIILATAAVLVLYAI